MLIPRTSSSVWNLVCCGLLPVVMAGTGGGVGSAGAQQASADVEIAALRYVRAALDQPDPRVGPVSSVVLDRRFGSADRPYARRSPMRGAEQSRKLAATLGSRLDDGDSVLGCDENARCRMAAPDVALIRVSPAVVQGDSAFTTVSLFRHTGSSRQPVSRVTWRLALRYDGGAWRVLPNRREFEST